MSDSIFHSCMESIRQIILDQNLTDIAPTNVLILKRLRDLQTDLPITPYPCILIGPMGSEALNPLGGTNRHDDVVYPIRIVMVALDSQNQFNNFDRNLLWRETIRRKINNKRLPGVDTCLRATVKPGSIVDAASWDKNKYVSVLDVEVTSRESRL